VILFLDVVLELRATFFQVLDCTWVEGHRAIACFLAGNIDA
jgi:hypothetical protein